MSGIHKVCEYLGEPYSVTTIDGEEVIYRDLENGFDFEVSGVVSAKSTCTLYVWSISENKEIVGIYSGIRGQEQLKDVLGYYAVKYQNLLAGIHVEREN